MLREDHSYVSKNIEVGEKEMLVLKKLSGFLVVLNTKIMM